MSFAPHHWIRRKAQVSSKITHSSEVHSVSNTRWFISENYPPTTAQLGAVTATSPPCSEPDQAAHSVMLFTLRCVYKIKQRQLPQYPSSLSPPLNTLFHNTHVYLKSLFAAMVNIRATPPAHKQHIYHYTRLSSRNNPLIVYSLNCCAVWKYKYSNAFILLFIIVSLLESNTLWGSCTAIPTDCSGEGQGAGCSASHTRALSFWTEPVAFFSTVQGRSLVFDTWLLTPEGEGMRRCREHVAPKIQTLAEVRQVKEEV